MCTWWPARSSQKPENNAHNYAFLLRLVMLAWPTPPSQVTGTRQHTHTHFHRKCFSFVGSILGPAACVCVRLQLLAGGSAFVIPVRAIAGLLPFAFHSVHVQFLCRCARLALARILFTACTAPHNYFHSTCGADILVLVSPHRHRSTFLAISNILIHRTRLSGIIRRLVFCCTFTIETCTKHAHAANARSFDEKRQQQLQQQRPSDNSVIHIEHMKYRIVCGIDGHKQ